MARYRKVEPKTWSDQKFRKLTAIPPCGQGLWMWFLTGPRTTNIPGIVLGSDAVMAAELRWELPDFQRVFTEISTAQMAIADWSAGFVWLPNAAKPDGERNKPESPNVIRSWRDTWEEIPECDLKLQVWQQLKDFAKGFGESFHEAFREAVRKNGGGAYPNQEQEQEQEQEEEYMSKTAGAVNGSATDPVGVVFRHWQEVHGHPTTKLDVKRRSLIRARLKDGFTVEQLCESISGYLHSTFHMGQNDRNRKFDAIELFMRDAKHVDDGIGFATTPKTSDLNKGNWR